MRLTVIGCGHLGATHAACMAAIGHDVLGVEIDEDRADLLNSGRAWFLEPGLDALLTRHTQSGRLRFTTSFAEAAAFATVHFLAVGTPSLPGGDGYDLSQVAGAVAALAPHLTTPALVIGKSTVPPGTTGHLARELRESAQAGNAVEVAWNPEFLREGHAVADTLRPDRIVVGVPSMAAEATVRELYRPLTEAEVPLMVTDEVTAELVKGAANAFLAMKVSFINAMSDVCRGTGADVAVLADALGMDQRIGRPFLTAGLGYGGGACRRMSAGWRRSPLRPAPREPPTCCPWSTGSTRPAASRSWIWCAACLASCQTSGSRSGAPRSSRAPTMSATRPALTSPTGSPGWAPKWWSTTRKRLATPL